MFCFEQDEKPNPDSNVDAWFEFQRTSGCESSNQDVLTENWRRTSTPKPEHRDSADVQPEERSPYTSWKQHLEDVPRKLKVRGISATDADLISGHITMKPRQTPETSAKCSETLPALNSCFLGLAIDNRQLLPTQKVQNELYFAQKQTRARVFT